MRRPRKTLLFVFVAAALALGAGAWAFAGGWTMSDGQAAFTLAVAKMPKGTTPSVAKQAKTAVVSWSAQEIATGVKMDHYVVTAHSVDEPPLADVVHTVAASGGSSESLVFAVGEVAGGKWYWTIVPKFRLWAGAESGKSQKLTFPAAAPVTATPAAPPSGQTATPEATTTSPATPSPAGTPTNGTPANGTPTDGTPANGTPAGGTSAGGGTPANGTPTATTAAGPPNPAGGATTGPTNAPPAPLAGNADPVAAQTTN